MQEEDEGETGGGGGGLHADGDGGPELPELLPAWKETRRQVPIYRNVSDLYKRFVGCLKKKKKKKK